MTTFSELVGPLTLLQDLAADIPELPAPHVELSPNRIQLSIHDDLSVFEQWRDALGLDFSAVRHHLQSGDTTTVLSAFGVLDDVKIQLTAYSRNVTLLRKVV